MKILFFFLNQYTEIKYFVGHQENEGLDHGLVLVSVNTENVHAQDQEKERESHLGHIPVKEGLGKGKRNVRKRDCLLSGQKH